MHGVPIVLPPAPSFRVMVIAGVIAVPFWLYKKPLNVTVTRYRLAPVAAASAVTGRLEPLDPVQVLVTAEPPETVMPPVAVSAPENVPVVAVSAPENVPVVEVMPAANGIATAVVVCPSFVIAVDRPVARSAVRALNAGADMTVPVTTGWPVVLMEKTPLPL